MKSVTPRRGEIKWLILLSGCLGLAGCDLINPGEPIPAYLYITPFSLETNVATQGSSAHKITDAWLTVDGEFLGMYPLPAVVPVLAQGPVEVEIQAGIKDNGISITPDIYPFYRPYIQQLDLEPGRMDTLRPVTRYVEGVRFSINETFESGATIFSTIIQGKDGIVPVTEDAFEGNYCGLIRLTADDPVVEVASLPRFSDLNAKGIFVYLEVNYKSDVPVLFGLIGHGSTAGSTAKIYEPGFLPRNEWNKIYFNLSPLLITEEYQSFQIAILAEYIPGAGTTGTNEARVWLDNIKLVHL